jgi:hypothetical protein
MANSTSTLIVGITMVILFTIAILGFAIGFANDNDAEVRIDNNANISDMQIFTKSSMQTFETETKTAYSSIVNTTIESGSDVIKSPTTFVVTWRNIFNTFGNILSVSFRVIFGSGGSFGIFLSIFGGLIGLLFTLYIIKAWRGNP